jgi:Sulfotransferase family
LNAVGCSKKTWHADLFTLANRLPLMQQRISKNAFTHRWLFGMLRGGTARIRVRELLKECGGQGVSRPVFIVGCGRSGTTMLGTALSKHDRITYLHERRDLWISAYPQTDVWTAKASARGGKIKLAASHGNARRSRKLRRAFRLELARSGRPVLLEKLPINSFRLEFIQSIFPDARYIHIHRNGVEVAKSIERFCAQKQWFGSDQYKWQQLSEVANMKTATSELARLCKTDFEKGLLEWRLSTEEVVRFLGTLPEVCWCEISYDELTAAPVSSIEQILSFIGLASHSATIEFARNSIFRRTAKVEQISLSERQRQIGGPLLPISMAGESEITRRYLHLL